MYVRKKCLYPGFALVLYLLQAMLQAYHQRKGGSFDLSTYITTNLAVEAGKKCQTNNGEETKPASAKLHEGKTPTEAFL